MFFFSLRDGLVEKKVGRRRRRKNAGNNDKKGEARKTKQQIKQGEKSAPRNFFRTKKARDSDFLPRNRFRGRYRMVFLGFRGSEADSEARLSKHLKPS